MKRILCLTDGFSLGGAERQLIGLAYFLKCKGYDVELCSYIKRDFYDSLIASYGLKAVCYNIEKGQWAKFKAVRNHIKRGKFDCVIVYKDRVAFIACVLKALGMKPMLIASDRNTDLMKTRKTNLKFRLFSFADYIVPNANAQCSFIKQNYPRLANKLVTINNFTDTKYFVPAEIKGPNGKKIEIMVAARIADQKNILRFLEVVKRLKESKAEIHIKWFGNVSFGEEGYESECKRLQREYSVEDVIEFLPATNNILYEYQHCDVFCLPSLYEGYPNAVCEAMSCGKPILCSRVCDNSLIVEEGVNGMLFNPLDIDNMYNTIYCFINLPQAEKEKMSKMSRILAEKKFSEEVFVQKYIELIES